MQQKSKRGEQKYAGDTPMLPISRPVHHPPSPPPTSTSTHHHTLFLMKAGICWAASQCGWPKATPLHPAPTSCLSACLAGLRPPHQGSAPSSTLPCEKVPGCAGIPTGRHTAALSLLAKFLSCFCSLVFLPPPPTAPPSPPPHFLTPPLSERSLLAAASGLFVSRPGLLNGPFISLVPQFQSIFMNPADILCLFLSPAPGGPPPTLKQPLPNEETRCRTWSRVDS